MGQTRTVPVVQLVCAGAALIGVCYGFARFAYGLFAPAVQREFAVGPTWFGVVGAGSYVGYGITITAGFVLANRYGPRRVAIAAGLVAAAGTLLVATAASPAMLAVGVLVAGSSTGLASPPMAAIVARLVRREHQDWTQSVVNAGTGLGVLLSGPIAIALAGYWRWAWGSFAVAALLVVGWLVRVVPEDPRPAPAAVRGSVFVPGAVRLWVAAALMGLCSSAIWVFGRDLVTTAGNADDLAAASLWTVIGVAGLLGAFSGHLVARRGIASAWTATMVVLATATALIACAPANPAVVYPAGVAFGAAYITLCGVVLLWSTRVYPDSAATGVGTSFLMIAVGQAAGAPLVGALIDNASYITAFLICAAVGAAGAALRPVRVAVPV